LKGIPSTKADKVYLKRGLAALWRSESQAQIGFEPRIARMITLGGPSEFSLIEALCTDHSLPQLRGIMTRAHGDLARVDELVGELTDGGALLNRARQSDHARIPVNAREFLAPSAESRALLRPDDGWPELARLNESTVHVIGLGRTGARIATVLATSGVGRLRLTDSTLVSRRDCGLDYGFEDVGRPRDVALKERIRSLPCSGITSIGPPMDDDATVLVDPDVFDIVRARDLVYNGVPHLSVILSETSITVGPWVTPGDGPCLRCIALHRTDMDSAWPAMATQLSASSAVAGRGDDSVLSALAGAYAAGQIISALTNHTPPCSGTTISFHLPDFSTSATSWPPHPECGCIAPAPDDAVLDAAQEPAPLLA
jgi:bacteriocin biosynthesis cyclodehydratase domain-containing protein